MGIDVLPVRPIQILDELRLPPRRYLAVATQIATAIASWLVAFRVVNISQIAITSRAEQFANNHVCAELV